VVNIKQYDEYEDFLHHKKEFMLFYENISKHTTLKNAKVLEVAAGSGKHTGFIVNETKYVLGIDRQNIINKPKLIDYYKKYGYELNPSNFDYIRADAQRLAFKKSKFDIVFCINAFEHIPNPEHALLEIHRVLKSGGYAFISFIPVYYCDTGSHMIDFISEPWAHLRHNEEDYIRKLREVSGGNEYFVNEFKYGLNRLPKRYFKALFDKYSVDSNNQKNKLPITLFMKVKSHLPKKRYTAFQILELHEWNGVEDNAYIQHENFKYLQEKYSTEDLLFRGMYILLKKIERDDTKGEH
jgi:ubiquinone/menaquinone biosynthesis C-methylase UbiE